MRLRSAASTEGEESPAEKKQLQSGTALHKKKSTNNKGHHQIARARKSQKKSSGSETAEDSAKKKGILGLLPTGLLGRLWPSERLIHGLLVAKWLRDELYNTADEVVLSLKSSSFSIDDRALSTSLTRWRNKGAKMELQFEDSGEFDDEFFIDYACGDFSANFFGLLEAFPNGAGAILVRLNLSFSFGHFGDTGVLLLAKTIKECKVLTSLELAGNELSDGPAMRLATELRHCTALRNLDLGGNFFTSWTALLSCLLENCKALRNLNLWHFGEDMSHASGDLPDAVEAISEHRLGANSLRALDVSCYNENEELDHLLTFEESETLARLLGSCGDLLALDLSRNGLSDSGFEEICSTEGLAKCTELIRLDVSETLIGAAGLRCLARAMEGCRNMRTLVLGSNNFGGESGSIVNVLHSCCHLDHLDLNYCSLGDDAMKPIAAALSHTTRLTRLELAGNDIYAAGAHALSQGVTACAALQRLNVERNKMGDEGVRWMAAVVRKCKKIERLDIGCNLISKSGVARLAQASTKKRKIVFGVGGELWVTKKDQEQLDRAWAGRCVFQWKWSMHHVVMILHGLVEPDLD